MSKRKEKKAPDAPQTHLEAWEKELEELAGSSSLSLSPPLLSSPAATSADTRQTHLSAFDKELLELANMSSSPPQSPIATLAMSLTNSRKRGRDDSDDTDRPNKIQKLAGVEAAETSESQIQERPPQSPSTDTTYKPVSFTISNPSSKAVKKEWEDGEDNAIDRLAVRHQQSGAEATSSGSNVTAANSKSTTTKKGGKGAVPGVLAFTPRSLKVVRGYGNKKASRGLEPMY